MSDGPFKNSRLTRRWQRFSDAVLNATFESGFCGSLAADGMVRETLTDKGQNLLADLKTYVGGKQMEFDQLSSIETIFDRHSKSTFADSLQKELMFRLGDQVAPVDVLRQALVASVKKMARDLCNRLEDECIRLNETGKMRQDQVAYFRSQVNEIFANMDTDKISSALFDQNKNAFKVELSKKEGLDDGPSLPVSHE